MLKLFEEKVPIEVSFGDLKIKLNSEFKCPSCGQKVKITKDDVLHAAEGVIATCAIYAQWNELIEKYEKQPEKFGDYFEFAAPLAKIEHDIMAREAHLMTSLNTSIKLPCGDAVNVQIDGRIEFKDLPDKGEVLRKLGLETKSAYAWLSYIFGGAVNEKAGKRKAQEIMDVLDAFDQELKSWELFEEKVTEYIPASASGIDGPIRAKISEGTSIAREQIRVETKSIISDIDTALARVAMRHGGLMMRGWIAKG